MIRVLYVDDEDDIREIAELCLGLEPRFDLRVCASGSEALDMAVAWRPQLILLDVMMPHMDGPETMRRLRSLEPTCDVPVVFVTARSHPADIERFTALGAAGVISKPFDPAGFASEAMAYVEGTA